MRRMLCGCAPAAHCSPAKKQWLRCRLLALVEYSSDATSKN